MNRISFFMAVLKVAPFLSVFYQENGDLGLCYAKSAPAFEEVLSLVAWAWFVAE